MADPSESTATAAAANPQQQRQQQQEQPQLPSMVNNTDNNEDFKMMCFRCTDTTQKQQETEQECTPYFVDLKALPSHQIQDLQELGLLQDRQICLLRQKHQDYLSRVWTAGGALSSSFVSLDASRPWILYWCLHGYDLIDESGGALPTEAERCRMVETMECCWSVVDEIRLSSGGHDWDLEVDPVLGKDVQQTSKDGTAPTFVGPGGGFGGSPGQMPHAATTYAAILALCILASSKGQGQSPSSPSLSVPSHQRALELLERIRKPLYVWFLSLQQPDGSYRMHHDGEVDVRATFTILCCAKLLNLCTRNLNYDAVAQFVGKCQTYEGGLGGVPYSEAHGGYAFCGLAALQLINRTDVLDMEAMRGWLVRRQTGYEGGFAGRTNKLVDGCYSFWQGGAMAIVSALFDPARKSPADSNDDADPWLNQNGTDVLPSALLFDAPMLERYILLCAQDVHGGLRDKPSKPRDFYHTCYNLSGLSLAQHYDRTQEHYGHTTEGKVHRTHPCYNIRVDRVKIIMDHFSKL